VDAVEPLSETPSTLTPRGVQTVFRAFDRREFLEWPSWTRLSGILASNGGSFGLSGPRGAGKSWLMLRAIDDVRGKQGSSGDRVAVDRMATSTHLVGIGLWYPSPSEYDPLAFLASLSYSLANEIERRFRRLYRFRDAVLSTRVLSLGVPALVAVAVYVSFAMFSTSRWNLIWAGLAALAAAVAVRAAMTVPYLFLSSFRADLQLLREAKLVRERARYTVTHREATELGGEAGRGGFTGRFRSSRERELAERPATLSTLVNDFRALAEQAGEVVGHVVIAVDELDKMSDPTKVRDLLRDIKGIFDVRRVHFLVSVSDEAARSLNLGALTERNEFNSSFYTVLELPPATPEHCAELLQRRAEVPRDVAVALAILAGGNPREVLRLAELVGDAPTGVEAVRRAFREEALSFRREIVTSIDPKDGPPLGQDARIKAFNALPDEAFDTSGALATLADTTLDPPLWAPAWSTDPGFQDRFLEPWRRLMVRLAVAGDLVRNPSIVQDAERGRRLQDAIIAASQSAEVGRIVLERGLRVEVRTEGVAQADARVELENLAREYEATRKRMRRGDERTAALDAIASRTRALAPDAGLTPDDVVKLVQGKADGDRIIGLVAVEATGEPAALSAVLDRVTAGATPFERFYALRALESLRPTLSADDRERVLNVLTDEKVIAEMASDTSRSVLADRIRRALENSGVAA
jgi:hypothetical protein